MFREFQLRARGRQGHPRKWVQECGVLPPPLSLSQVLLPLSGLTLKCSARPLNFPVISNTGPDHVIGHHSAHGRPVYHFYFLVHRNSSRVIFQIVSTDNRIKEVHKTHSKSIQRSTDEAGSQVHSRCSFLLRIQKQKECSTADNCQRLMIPAEGSLISF